MGIIVKDVRDVAENVTYDKETGTISYSVPEKDKTTGKNVNMYSTASLEGPVRKLFDELTSKKIPFTMLVYPNGDLTFKIGDKSLNTAASDMTDQHNAVIYNKPLIQTTQFNDIKHTEKSVTDLVKAVQQQLKQQAATPTVQKQAQAQ